MKKELFEYTQEEAQAFMSQDEIRELDYVKDDGYKLFARNLQENVKLRLYEDGKAMIEIVVPAQLQCVPCGIQFKTDDKETCPCCNTSIRDIMLRNKVTEEPFREFEYIYGKLLTASLKVAQPLCAWAADNFTEEFAIKSYSEAVKEREEVLEELNKFSWIFEGNIIDRIRGMKKEKENIAVMRELTGGDTSDASIADFKK